MKKQGCLFWILVFLICSIAIGFSPFLWIPAIGFLIFFIIKKNTKGSITSAAILVISLILFIWIVNMPESTETNKIADSNTSETLDTNISSEASNTNTSTEISEQVTLMYATENINVRAGAGTEYEIVGKLYTGEEVRVYSTDNDWSRIDYTDGEYYVSANYLDHTPPETNSSEEVIVESSTQEAENDIPSSTNNSSPADNPTPESTVIPQQSSNDTYVWVDDTAAKYHKKNGCGMDNAYQVTLAEAQAMGKTPCGRCYK